MESGNIATADGFRTAYAEIFSNVGALAASLDDERSMLATGCPGWTVRDHVAHITDLESILIGRPRAEHIVPEGLRATSATSPASSWRSASMPAAHVPLADLLAEYRDVTEQRLARLATLEDSQLDEMGRGFFGESKVRSLLAIRVFDLWAHEQDIRRALHEPGGLDGIAAAHSRERMLMGAGNELQERVAPPAGTSIVFDVTGTGGALRSITFDGDRGRAGASIPDTPTSTLRLDLPTLTVLACGRSDDPGARSRVVVEGDQNLAEHRARGPGGDTVSRRSLSVVFVATLVLAGCGLQQDLSQVPSLGSGPTGPATPITAPTLTGTQFDWSSTQRTRRGARFLGFMVRSVQCRAARAQHACVAVGAEAA